MENYIKFLDTSFYVTGITYMVYIALYRLFMHGHSSDYNQLSKAHYCVHEETVQMLGYSYILN